MLLSPINPKPLKSKAAIPEINSILMQKMIPVLVHRVCHSLAMAHPARSITKPTIVTKAKPRRANYARCVASV